MAGLPRGIRALRPVDWQGTTRTTRKEPGHADKTLCAVSFSGDPVVYEYRPLDPERDLRSLTVRCLANEVVVGLMSATLLRP